MTSISRRSLHSTSRDAVRNISTHPEHFIHITDEVTNPALLEHFITEHPIVHSAIMFGHGRYNAGVLIELEDVFKIDPNDTNKVEQTRNRLQPVIERMNMFAPQHARVQKEMIIFASPKKPFICTPFGSSQVNRHGTLTEYNGEINALYKTIARAAHMALNPPKVWSPKNSLVYVRGIIVAVLGRKLDDNADFFEHGTDSLQATRIRIILFHALRSTTKMDTRKLSGNIAYQYPTITGLSAFATRTVLACFRHRTESSLARCLEMMEMARSHSLNFPVHQPSIAQSRDDVVLITGTTGLFGSNLLAEFLQCPKIKKVYALNHKRSRPGSVVEKQASLLQACGLDPALARHPKLTLIDAEASRSRLGLCQDLYEQLLASVTHIVHNAWLSTYDGSLPLSIFDGSFHILRNLVDFALSSPLPVPPRLLFISTTDTIRGQSSSLNDSESETTGPVTLEGPVSACDAAGSPHSESKWVGEQILAAAASETPLRPIIVRVGPLCGAANGRWREEALLPMIVHLGVALGALPKIDEVVHWTPVHIAAQAIADMRHSTSSYLHLTHSHPLSSLSLLRNISDELHLPLISLPQWTTKLEAHVHTMPGPDTSTKWNDTALIVLRHIYLAKDPTATDNDAPTRIFDHTRIASSVSTMEPLGSADVKLWVRHWREVGIVPDAP